MYIKPKYRQKSVKSKIMQKKQQIFFFLFFYTQKPKSICIDLLKTRRRHQTKYGKNCANKEWLCYYDISCNQTYFYVEAFASERNKKIIEAAA